jgi:hypothetical protein
MIVGLAYCVFFGDGPHSPLASLNPADHGMA